MPIVKQDNDSIICVKAKFKLLPFEVSGKTNSIGTGYRPNHAFKQLSDVSKMSFYLGEIQFSDQERINPGETKDVVVMFARFGNIEKYLLVGRKWFIYEVPRFVAEGEICEVIYFS